MLDFAHDLSYFVAFGITGLTTSEQCLVHFMCCDRAFILKYYFTVKPLN